MSFLDIPYLAEVWPVLWIICTIHLITVIWDTVRIYCTVTGCTSTLPLLTLWYSWKYIEQALIHSSEGQIYFSSVPLWHAKQRVCLQFTAHCFNIRLNDITAVYTRWGFKTWSLSRTMTAYIRYDRYNTTIHMLYSKHSTSLMYEYYVIHHSWDQYAG